MAMTKTEVLSNVSVYPNQTPMGGSEPQITVHAKVLVSWDDPDDSDMPVSKVETRVFNEGDDVSGQAQLVQDICAAAWTDD